MINFWKHALGTGVGAEMLARKLKISKPEEAFTCGLLHDIGKLVLHQIDPDRLTAILKETEKRKSGFFEVEKEWDLPGHSYLGEVIASKWGLPQVIRLAIRYHHFDVAKMDSILASAKPVIQIVTLANTLCVKNGIGASGDCSSGEVTQAMIAPLGIQMSEIPQIEADLIKDIDRAGAFLNAYR
jgi:putative nucleotidyltransferase with HDIG domain